MLGQTMTVDPIQEPIIQQLVQQFGSQNQEMAELIEQLINLGHRVSNTNVPEPGIEKTPGEKLPFGEGHLLELSHQLKTHQRHIWVLRDLHNKLNPLI